MTTRQAPSKFILAVVAIVTLFSLFLLTRLETNTQDWQNWVEVSSQSRKTFDQYKSLFGSSDYLIVSWPGCDDDDQRLGQFLDALSKLDEAGLIEQAIDGPSVVEQMLDSSSRFTRKSAKNRLKGTLYGRDSVTTGTSIKLSKSGSEQRKQSIELISQAADEVPELGRKELRIGGSAFVNAELDSQTNQSMLFAAPGIAIAFIVTWFSLGCIRLTMAALTTSGLSALFSLALVLVCGYKVNGLTVLMPMLVLTITLSSAIHLLAYFRSADETHSEKVKVMLTRGWKPATFAMVTSAIGVGSLIAGRVPAVKQFGLFSSLAILIGLVLLLVVLPELLRLTLLFDRKTTQTNPIVIGRYRTALLTLVTNYPKTVVLLFLAALLATGIFLPALKIELDNENLFSAKSRFRQNSAWLENNLVPLESIGVVVQIPKDHPLKWNEQLYNVGLIQNKVRTLTPIRSSFSALNVLPQLPGRGSDVSSTMNRNLFNETIESRFDDFRNNDLFAESEQFWNWRIQLGCNSNEQVDYQELVGQINKEIKTIQFIEDEPQILISGMSLVASQGNQSLFQDLSRSFLIALVVIALMMMVLLRSVVAGAFAMLPNLTPPIILFGLLAMIRYPVDIGMVLTASVGLGIAVDNTFHFLHSFKQLATESGNAKRAVKKAFIHCHIPMLQTTSICCCGLLCFVFAEFVPVRQFALAIVVILLLALAADLVLLPALVSLRKSRLFVR